MRLDRKFMACVLAAAFSLAGVLNCYAETTQQQIDDARAKKNETQADYKSAQQVLEDLKSKKDDEESYLSELNDQMADLESRLEDLQNKYDKKEKELKKVEAELEEAEATEEEQYENMKLRIQFMYEQSDSSYLDILLSSDSFADFLNKADNISAISEYDRERLAEYEETIDTVTQKRQEVQTEQEEITVLQEECEAEEAEVSVLVEDTYTQIQKYSAKIEDEQSEVAGLLKKINEQEDALNALIKKKKDEEAAAKKAAEEAAAKKAAEEAAAKKAAARSASKSSSSGQSSSNTSGNSSSGTTADTQDTSGSSGSSSGKYLGKFKLTAYCPCAKCCGKSDGITASGTRATAGRTVAMGGLPLGTKISINGQVYVVEDRGTVYGHVDIFMNTHSAALAYGVHYADVYLVD